MEADRVGWDERSAKASQIDRRFKHICMYRRNMQIFTYVRTNIKCVMMDIILFLFGMEFMEYLINSNIFFFLLIAALKVKLMVRRSVNQLVEQGIFPREYQFVCIF